MLIFPNTDGIEKITANNVIRQEIQKKIDPLKNILITKPHDINTLVRLGFYYFAGRSDGEGIKAFKKALEIDPNNVDTCMWFSELLLFGWADFEAVLPILEHALSLNYKRADIHHLMACAYREHNTIDSRVKEKYHLLKSIELEPTWLTDRISLIELLIKNKEFQEAKDALHKAYKVLNKDFPIPTDNMQEYYENLITGRLYAERTEKALDNFKKIIDENLEKPLQ